MENKIALVTGGSRGLGKDMAVSLAQKGLGVVITYKDNAAGADAVVREITGLGQKAVAVRLDMSIPGNIGPFTAALKDVLRKNWGVEKFDYLVNNAGIGATIPMDQMTEEVFDQFVNVHYKSVYFLTQQSLRLMNDGGGVVFVSSGTTRFSIPGYSVYGSLKGAIEVLTKYVAKEYGARGIRSNVVAPGPIETDFNDAAIRNNPQMKGFLSSITALGRVGVAEDVGGVVAFLCSEEARWINGQRIEVSGGINV
jgi:NAD(P)-dependent dehydrogenase (short-subunit alcohol dehydrogenase family)